MDVFDKFFQRYSYKFDKGYPNMDNHKDVLIIENILKELIVMEFEDKGDIPNDIEKIRVNINNSEAYVVDAIQKPRPTQETYWVYINDVPSTSRPARLEVTKDLMAKGLFPKGEIKKFKDGGYYIETEDGIKLVVKGAGSKFTTSTTIKEGFVVAFYNALQQGWNSSQEPFNSENMSSLLTKLQEKNIYKGLGKAEKNVSSFLELYDGESSSKAAQVSLNDPLSAALRIYNDYNEGDLLRDGIFDTIKRRAEQITGLPSDKVNPGDVFLRVGKATLPPKNEVDVTGLEEINKLFVNEWGSTDSPLVSISLKQERAQGGKAKSFLAKYKPENVEGNLPISYNLSDEEMDYTDDEYDKALNGYKEKIKQQVGDSEFITLNIEDNPTKTEQKKFTLAAYKALDYLFSYLDKLGASSPENGLVKMAAFGMSITDVNPTFFKVIGNSSGKEASTPEKIPAGATAELSPGTTITIKDGQTNGSIKIDLEVDILVGKDVYSQYALELVLRSNGGSQNTIEIQKAKKK
tara:strand:+ start:200 stop:1759 length:1560 start_codon:yes stop_codon:yes gene_type:complete